MSPSMTVSDVERPDGPNLLDGSLRMLVLFAPTETTVGMVTHIRQGRVVGISHAPNPQWRSPVFPSILRGSLRMLISFGIQQRDKSTHPFVDAN